MVSIGIIKIFVTSIKTAEKKPRVVRCWRYLGVIRRSSFKTTPYGINATCERLQNNLSLMVRGKD